MQETLPQTLGLLPLACLLLPPHQTGAVLGSTFAEK